MTGQTFASRLLKLKIVWLERIFLLFLFVGNIFVLRKDTHFYKNFSAIPTDIIILATIFMFFMISFTKFSKGWFNRRSISRVLFGYEDFCHKTYYRDGSGKVEKIYSRAYYRDGE